MYGRVSALALLLDAGASLNPCDEQGRTPLFYAARHGQIECVKLLVARGGEALEVDREDNDGRTPLYKAAGFGNSEVVRCLLQAGADPTSTFAMPVYVFNRCRELVEDAAREPKRAITLFKARSLLDADRTIDKARADARGKGLEPVLKVAPAYLKGRVKRGKELPWLVVGRDGGDPAVLASIHYVLGLDGAGEGSTGLPPELFVELLEFIVPKWDPARKGKPLEAFYAELGLTDVFSQSSDYEEEDEYGFYEYYAFGEEEEESESDSTESDTEDDSESDSEDSESELLDESEGDY